jgi:hypothetical protein
MEGYSTVSTLLASGSKKQQQRQSYESLDEGYSTASTLLAINMFSA